MRKLEPQIAVKALNDVPNGALVIFQHAVAFAAFNPSARVVTLAAHDAPNGRFVYRYFDSAQPNVLVVVRNNSVTCRPARGNIRDAARQGSVWLGRHTTLRGDGANWEPGGRGY
jgi:hypothetical protein